MNTQYEWEALATRVFDLSDDQLLQTYVHGLKPYIRDELEMHNITTMEKARCKEKTAKNKLKRLTQNYDKVYSR
jgi:hypothetical protein